MTDYYLRTAANGGSDAANGLSAGAAWATFGKALGASGIASGDHLYVGAGTYREVVTVAMTSAVAETKLTGDVDGLKTGDAGEVIWSAYTTNDTTAPSANPTLNLSARDFLTFERLTFIGGNASQSCVNGTTTNSTNITFTECLFVPGAQDKPLVSYTGLADVAASWLFDRCLFFCTGANQDGVNLTFPTSSVADYDVGFVLKNCRISGPVTGQFLFGNTSGANSFKPGGLQVWNCTAIHCGRFILLNNANFSTSIPATVYDCFIWDSVVALASTSSGQITEDYNAIYAGTARSNVSAGAHSQAFTAAYTYAALLHLGQAMWVGNHQRPFLTPGAGSPLLGFGNQASAPTVDAWNRARPSGGASGSAGIGYLERHDNWVKETSTTDAGSVGLRITGPGDQDIDLAVDASSTVVTVKMRFDSSYGGASKPQAILLANGEIGVATETKTMTAAADTWETLTFSTFTPSTKGVVTVRLVSRDTGATGKTFADTLVVGSVTTDFAYFRRGEVLQTASYGAAAAGGGLLVNPGLRGGMI